VCVITGRLAGADVHASVMPVRVAGRVTTTAEVFASVSYGV
jgi:hypothetical protein